MNTTKSLDFIYMNNFMNDKEIVRLVPFTIPTKIFK